MGSIPTDRFACSDNAGKWMYGNLDYKVVKNAIDIDKYIYNEETRKRVREKWNMNDKVVYSHVGIYMPAKNHKFLIETFSYIVKKQPNAMLVLIGEGELRAEMEAQILELGIGDNVILTGVRRDVEELLQMTDVFMFPSIYEGLPLSLIEAQSAGLRCLISDVITREVVVTDLVTQLPLSLGAEEWADKAIELSKEAAAWPRRNTRTEVANAGYDVKRLINGKKLVLITGHRRENFGDGFIRMVTAMKDLSEKYSDVDFVYPMHLNPNVRKPIHEVFGKDLTRSNFFFIEPLQYLEFVHLMSKATIVLTDSGGIQEEAPTFGCPTLVMRYETERQEGIDAGVSILVGADYDKIVSHSEEILSKPKEQTRLKAQNPYGNGKSSQIIERIINNYFSS